MELCVIGTGYVGLVTGACFADLGNHVTCVDVDKAKVARLQKGQIPIFEPGLEEVVRRNLKNKRLSFSTSLKQGLAKAEVAFIAVGTPSLPNGEANLEFVKEVARGIGKNVLRDLIVVDKSTVPVGMGDLVESLVDQELEKRRSKLKVQVASCPEFLREGSALYDFMNPDRIVIGSRDARAAERVAELFKNLPGKKLLTDLRSAEMIKYASNAFLATKISFINEIANLCERVHADVQRVAEGMGLDKRIGAAFLQAGAGYGGSCFPKDVSALVQIAWWAPWKARPSPSWAWPSRPTPTTCATPSAWTWCRGSWTRGPGCGPTTPPPAATPRPCCPGPSSAAAPWKPPMGRIAWSS